MKVNKNKNMVRKSKICREERKVMNHSPFLLGVATLFRLIQRALLEFGVYLKIRMGNKSV